MVTTVQKQTNCSRFVLALGFDGVLLMDVAGPAQAFSTANKVLGRKAYDIAAVTQEGRDFVTDTGLSLGVKMGFDDVIGADFFVVPGGPGVDQLLSDATLQDFLRQVDSKTERFVSVCSGSLLTASAGLLDGRRATTHWEREHLAKNRFPRVAWHLDEIFTQDGKFHCSAGVTTGIDLTLALIEADHGRHIALDVAREMVVFMKRHGGQPQFSAPLQAQSSCTQRLSDLYSQIEQDPASTWTVRKMAKIAGMTERTLHREFVRDFAQTPAHFVEERRIAVARLYLENSTKPIKEIAFLSGFDTEQKLRRSFVRLLGIPPTTYRNRFGVR